MVLLVPDQPQIAKACRLPVVVLVLVLLLMLLVLLGLVAPVAV